MGLSSRCQGGRPRGIRSPYMQRIESIYVLQIGIGCPVMRFRQMTLAQKGTCKVGFCCQCRRSVNRDAASDIQPAFAIPIAYRHGKYRRQVSQGYIRRSRITGVKGFWCHCRRETGGRSRHLCLLRQWKGLIIRHRHTLVGGIVINQIRPGRRLIWFMTMISGYSR